MLELIEKKLAKGKTYAQIAEDLEEEVSVIKELAGELENVSYIEHSASEE